MTESTSTQLGGHARLRAELVRSARLLERMGGFLQGIVIVVAAVGLIAAFFVGTETECIGGSPGPGGVTTCVAGSTHPHLALAFALGVGVVLLAVALTGLLQLMVVIGRYCSYNAYGTRSDWIDEQD